MCGVLVRAEDVVRGTFSLLSATGPIQFQVDRENRYLWTQRGMRGTDSALKARPDLTVTLSPDVPDASNVSRIIEAKCVRKIGAQLVRTEFGKAHDLRVTAYLIWSYFSPPLDVVHGARQLGIDLEPLGFDTDRRSDLVSDPEALIARVAYQQEETGRSQRFARALAQAGSEAVAKLSVP